MTYTTRLDQAISEVTAEVFRAKQIHPGDFNSMHEGYGVLLEELDELWDEIKKKDFNKQAARTEAVQSSAMLMRLIVEIL